MSRGNALCITQVEWQRKRTKKAGNKKELVEPTLNIY